MSTYTVRAFPTGQCLALPYSCAGLLWPRGTYTDVIGGVAGVFKANRLVSVTATDADPSIGQIDPLTEEVTIGPTMLATLQADPHLEVVAAG